IDVINHILFVIFREFIECIYLMYLFIESRLSHRLSHRFIDVIICYKHRFIHRLRVSHRLSHRFLEIVLCYHRLL
ncbi:hypothetical protein L9F63_016893, partial [Diploptera punctata]